MNAQIWSTAAASVSSPSNSALYQPSLGRSDSHISQNYARETPANTRAQNKYQPNAR